jgi:hypothetical protein
MKLSLLDAIVFFVLTYCVWNDDNFSCWISIDQYSKEEMNHIFFDPPSPLKGGYKPIHYLICNHFLGTCNGFQPPFRGAGGVISSIRRFLSITSTLLLINMLQVTAQYKGDHCIVKSEFIYQPGDVLFPSYHASTIVQNGKELLAAWWGELITSDDEGKTWSQPCRLPEDIIGPVKNKPLLLKNGYLLCPSSTENEGWRIHMEFTSDNGRTWERTP